MSDKKRGGRFNIGGRAGARSVEQSSEPPPVNTAPVATNGTATVPVLGSVTGTLSASDADLDALTYSIVANGTLGTLYITNASTGAYNYIANGAVGTDSITWRAYDGAAYSNEATLTVTLTAVSGTGVGFSIDYTAETIGHGTFSRDGTATKYNYSTNTAYNRHLTASVADGLPCYEYTLADGICRGVMVRPPMMDLVGGDNDLLSAWAVETTSIASVAQNAVGINGTANTAWTLTGTDKTTTAARYAVSQTFAANEAGASDAESADISYTGTDPTPGMILMVTDAAATTESGICYVVGVDSGANTMQVMMLSGTINNTDTFFEPGSAVVYCTASSALAERTLTSLTEPVPMVAWARVKKGNWPWVSFRLRNELGVSQDFLFDLEEGRVFSQEPSASLIRSECFGLRYLHDGWFLLYAVYPVISSSASNTIKFSLGFGKPEAYYVSTYHSQAIRDDILYGATSGARARVRFDFTSSQNIIYVDQRIGTFQTGEILRDSGATTNVATIIVESTPTYNTSYTWMCVSTNAASSATEAINCSAKTLIVMDSGLCRGFHIPRTPIDNTVTFAEPTNPTTYYIQNPETLSYSVSSIGRTMPTNNFSLILQAYNPIKAFSTRWRASTAIAVKAICTPFNSPYTFRCTTAGTTGTSEPDWTTVSAVNTTKADNTATWTSYGQHEFYLWACGTASLRRTHRYLRYYHDASNYIEWAVNDSRLYFKDGTSASVTPTRGNTVTGASSGATGLLLATPSLDLDAGSFGSADARGHLSLRVTSGTFIDGETLNIGANAFASAVGIAARTNYGTFDEGIYNIGIHQSSTTGAELWVNGFLVASNETLTGSLSLGSNWYLGTDTNGVNHGGWIYTGIRVQSDYGS